VLLHPSEKMHKGVRCCKAVSGIGHPSCCVIEKRLLNNLGGESRSLTRRLAAAYVLSGDFGGHLLFLGVVMTESSKDPGASTDSQASLVDLPTAKPALAEVDPKTAADIKGGATTAKSSTTAQGSTTDINPGHKVAVDL
jgi:hypothetical protein